MCKQSIGWLVCVVYLMPQILDPACCRGCPGQIDRFLVEHIRDQSLDQILLDQISYGMAWDYGTRPGFSLPLGGIWRNALNKASQEDPRNQEHTLELYITQPSQQQDMGYLFTARWDGSWDGWVNGNRDLLHYTLPYISFYHLPRVLVLLPLSSSLGPYPFDQDKIECLRRASMLINTLPYSEYRPALHTFSGQTYQQPHAFLLRSPELL